MNSRLAGTLGVWVVAGATLVVADFWETKAFTAWSDTEVEKMLSDSSWAKQQRIVLGSLSEEPEFQIQPLPPSIPRVAEWTARGEGGPGWRRSV